MFLPRSLLDEHRLIVFESQPEQTKPTAMEGFDALDYEIAHNSEINSWSRQLKYPHSCSTSDTRQKIMKIEVHNKP